MTERLPEPQEPVLCDVCGDGTPAARRWWVPLPTPAYRLVSVGLCLRHYADDPRGVALLERVRARLGREASLR